MSDELHIKRERSKARDLRKSVWWQTRLDSKPECYYCQTVLTKAQITMDHVVPLSRGGKTSKSNVVVCCKDCNNKKKWMTASEWATSHLVP